MKKKLTCFGHCSVERKSCKIVCDLFTKKINDLLVWNVMV